MLLLPFGAILFSLLVSAYAVYKGGKQPIIRFLVIALLFLSLEQVLLCWRLLVILPSNALLAQQLMQVLQVLSLCFALAFSFGYGQVYGWERIKREKWLLLATTAVGLMITLFPFGEQTSGLPFRSESGWMFELGLRGQIFYVYILLVSTLVLINLEKLLRSSYGRIRWQLKFSVVGLGTFFALRIYQSGNALMFSTWQQQLDGITAVGLILASACLVIGLRRTAEGIDIYLSTDLLKNSVVSLIVGSYLLGVGLLVALFRYLDLDYLVEMSFLIVAALFLALALISDRSRQAARLFTQHHFRRPSYDYRILWNRFIGSTSTIFDETRIARDVVRMISETLQLISVAIWTYDASCRNFTLSASSATLDEYWKEIDPIDFERVLNSSEGIIDLDDIEANYPEPSRFRNNTGCQYLIPLKGKDSLLGFLAFGQKVGHGDITLEDRELLDVLGQQTASALLNVSLFRKMAEVSEAEALRNMSAFFLHDMKNLANQLSLTVQNLPKYYDNEEFRTDALRVLSESVSRIKRMSSGMLLLKEEMKVRFAPENLNDFVEGILVEMRSEIGGLVKSELREIPLVSIDREQMRKVLVNLLLNGRDAVKALPGSKYSGTPEVSAAGQENSEAGEQGKFPICVSTSRSGTGVILEVSDKGCGMPEEFIREKLFQAFQTTKQQGSTFRVFLPAAS